MDIVYILGNGSEVENKEIRYSLRSLEKFTQFNRIFIVGECPTFLKNIIHIPFKETGNPRVNHFEKIDYIINNVKDLSEDFLLMYDDIFFLKPTDIEKYPNYYKSELENYNEPDSYFKKSLSDTKEYLESIGATTYNFSVHTPIIYNKTVWKSIDWKAIYKYPHGLSPRCIYGNLCKKTPIKREDCKYKYPFEIKSEDCFSIYSESFPDFRKFLLKRFEAKSPFEKLFENLTEVKDFIKGKRVAIVGNAESIFSKNNGEKIDSFDVVIRFNKGFITIPKSQGTKTNILIMACELTEKERESYNAKFYINRMKRFENPTPLHFLNTDIITIGKEITNARVSSGFIAINLCAEAQAKSIDLFGFDWEATPTFYNPKDYKTLHNYSDEKELVFSKFEIKVN